MLENEKVLVTGVTGQVGLPVARALAARNEVWGTSRFKDAAARSALEDEGVHCAPADFITGDFSALPDDFTYVLDFAVMRANDWDRDLEGNVGGLGFLMEHCRRARAFLHCSSAAVYQPHGHAPFAESDPLGDNHRAWGFLSTYSISKIAAEAMAKYAARRWNIPTTIARLSVPYGDNGGWPAVHLEMMMAGSPIPVHVDTPSHYNPVHEDDIVTMLSSLLDIASVPATVVNWGGDDIVSIEEWCGYLGKLTGLEPRFAPTDQTIDSIALDVTRMHELVGKTSVGWRDGMRRMVAHRHPELLKSDA